MENFTVKKYLILIIVLTTAALFAGFGSLPDSQAQQNPAQGWIYGTVSDTQNQPVSGVQVNLISRAAEEPRQLQTALSQGNGSFALQLPEDLDEEEFGEDPALIFDRAHFELTTRPLTEQEVQTLENDRSLTLTEVTLEREITAAFWVATAVFGGMLILIATGFLHNTLASLAGIAVVFAVSYLGSAISEDLYIFTFPRALHYIDWNVIFLIMGMMMVIAVVENTGVFHWLAYFAYRISGGRMWVLLPVLMLITGVSSAFLDNVTTMLLMTPFTVQIAIALGISPLALLLPEVFASNVIGVSTLIGTPTNILIGSYADISFNDFLINLTPGVLLSFIGLTIYSWLIYRKELTQAKTGSPVLLEKLAERGRITNPKALKKAGWVGLGMLLLFVFGENIHLLPSVTALMGATALLVWLRPDVEEMIGAVDWTTLVFFMSLFMVVGAIQEVGLISLIASWIGDLVGSNLGLAMVVLTTLSAVLSMIVANIPFTAAMLPVVGFLSTTIPGTEGKVLFYCLSVGAAMGGNGSLIGASANMITAGIAERAGYKITYNYFLKKGFPALLITVGLSLGWLFIRFR